MKDLEHIENVNVSEYKSWIPPDGYQTIVRRKTRIDELCEQFQEAAANDDINTMQFVLTELAKTEDGEMFIKKTVKSVMFNNLDTSESKRRVAIVENYIIPFCNANKINITKKHLKTI